MPVAPTRSPGASTWLCPPPSPGEVGQHSPVQVFIQRGGDESMKLSREQSSLLKKQDVPVTHILYGDSACGPWEETELPSPCCQAMAAGLPCPWQVACKLTHPGPTVLRCEAELSAGGGQVVPAVREPVEEGRQPPSHHCPGQVPGRAGCSCMQLGLGPRNLQAVPAITAWQQAMQQVTADQ